MNEIDKKFSEIKKAMRYRDQESKVRAQKYLNNNIKEILKHRRHFSVEEILLKPNELKNISGVYLIFYKVNNKIVFTYVGETKDILKRWTQHIKNFSVSKKTMYKKIRSKTSIIESEKFFFSFVILKKEVDENMRLYCETANIFKFKIKNISINSKNCSWKLKCPKGHGRCRAFLDYKNAETFQLLVKAKCMNKNCDYFYINN